MLPYNLRQALNSIPGPTAMIVNLGGLPSVLVKAEQEDVQAMNRGPAGRGIVIAVTPMLGLYDSGSVFRFLIHFLVDPPDGYVEMDTFLNPSASDDLMLLFRLVDHSYLDFYLVNLRLDRIGAKRIRWNPNTRNDMRLLITQALAHNAGIRQVDFRSALARMKDEYRIGGA